MIDSPKDAPLTDLAELAHRRSSDPHPDPAEPGADDLTGQDCGALGSPKQGRDNIWPEQGRRMHFNED